MSIAAFYPNWKEKIVYSAEGPKPQILLDEDRMRVVLAGLEPGQRIPAHPENLSVFHFLEGHGWMTVDVERQPVGPGATVIAPQGSERAIEATTRLAFLAVRLA